MADILDNFFLIYKEQIKEELQNLIDAIGEDPQSEIPLRLPYSSLLCENKAFKHISKLLLEKYYMRKIAIFAVYSDETMPNTIEIIFKNP